MTYNKRKLGLLIATAIAFMGIPKISQTWAATQRKPAQKSPAVPFPDDEFEDEEFIDTPPPKGAGGSSPFGANNPPAGGTTAKAPSEPLNDEDFEDLSDEALRQRLEERIRDKAGVKGNDAPSGGLSGGSYNDNNFGGGFDTKLPTSYGGGGGLGKSEAFQSNKGPGCLKLDPDTGFGPDVITNFDFPDADVVEIAKTLGKLTCVNFIMDKDVRGRISIVSNAPITVGDAWKAFLSSLDTNQLTIVPAGKYLRIMRQNLARDKNIKTYSGTFAPDTDGMITRVLPLKYIDAEEVRRVFMQILSPTTRMLAYQQTNTLIITDTASTIKKIVDLVALLDIEGYDESLHVLKIHYASAEEIAKLIDQLLPGQGGGAPGAPPGIPRFGKGFSQRKTKEGGVISNIIADARTNSLIVNANSKGVEAVRKLISKLDTKVKLSAGGSRIHVVYLQYADAEQVATTLNNLTSGSSASNMPKTPAFPGAAPSSQAVLFEGNVKVAADKPTNSLVITASPTDFAVVRRVLGKLDVPRDQVYVEAVIMELSLDKAFNMSSSVVSPSNGVGFMPDTNLANFLMNPLTGVQGLAMGFTSGKKSSFTTADGKSVSVSNIQGLITALQTNANSNILATPQILTLDNQEANIEIGETVPVPSVTNVANSGSQQSFNRDKVSLSLTIKPQINKISNFVKMDIKQKFADFNNRAVPKALQDQSYGTIERSSQTTVVVQDQDSVVLGGLMRDKISESSTKVPILGDIPLLGWLFRAKSTSSQKTNLLVFITPRIVKQYQTVRKILDRKLEERDEFLETANGGKDPYEKEKLKMIRELKPIGELKDNYKVENTEIEGADDSDSDDDDDDLIKQRTARSGVPSNIPARLQDVPANSINTATAPGQYQAPAPVVENVVVPPPPAQPNTN